MSGRGYYGDVRPNSAAAASPSRLSSAAAPTSSSSSSSDDDDDDDVRSLIDCPVIRTRHGLAHPAIGFGTYKVGIIPASSSAAVSGDVNADSVTRTAEEVVCDALSVGYRFLECGEFYGNEVEVGRAIKKSGVPRYELFLCSKVWTTTIEKGPKAIEEQLERTLKDLGTDYLDLYLIHWPVPGHHVAAYKALEELVRGGKVRAIGLSNYSIEDYEELKGGGITIPPDVNQIEINPFLYRRNTIDYFRNEMVTMQSYRSLRDGKAFDHPVLKRIARSHGRTSAQVLGRWCVQHGFVYMPKSVKKSRMIENAKVFDFELTEEEMEELDGLTDGDAIETFRGLYRKCVNRDTTRDGTLEGVKMDITAD